MVFPKLVGIGISQVVFLVDYLNWLVADPSMGHRHKGCCIVDSHSAGDGLPVRLPAIFPRMSLTMLWLGLEGDNCDVSLCLFLTTQRDAMNTVQGFGVRGKFQM